MCPDCFLYTLGCFLWDIDLTTHILGEFARGLVVFGAAGYIGLLWTPGTLTLDFLAYLGQMAKFHDSYLGSYC